MENELEKRQEKIFSLFQKKDILLWTLILIMVLTFGIRLYYFNNYHNQTLWWDEAQYVWRSRDMARGNWFVSGWDTNSWMYEGTLPPHKPFLMVFIGALFYLFRLDGEMAIKFFMVLISTLGVLFTYLVGKELYNKKTGLIASALMSTFYLYNFWTYRIETNILGTALWLITVFLFWKGYVKIPNKKYMFLAGIFMMLTIMGRTTMLMMIVPILAIFIIKERLALVKSAYFWLFGLGNLIILIPYAIWSQLTYKMPLAFATEWFGGGANAGKILENASTLLQYVKYFFAGYLPSPIKILPILLVIGLGILLFNAVIGLDIMIKKKDERIMKYTFLLLWFFVPLFLFGLWVDLFEDRWLFVVFPAVFIIIGNVLVKGYNLFKKYGKIPVIAVIVLIVVSSMFMNIKSGDELIKSKTTSYLPVKEASLWIKQNSLPEDVIISQSSPQMAFYADREVIRLHKKIARYVSELNESERYLTVDEFEKVAKETKAKYFVVSIFEGHPNWTYSYANENQDKAIPVQAYFLDQEQKQVALVIYELNFTK